MEWIVAHVRPVVDLIFYSALSTVILFLCVVFIEWVIPFSVRKEIEEDQNVALGIVMAAFIVGVAIIISAVLRS